MPTPFVIITGKSASGKSTFLSRFLAENPLPCASRDSIKEGLFDFLGLYDRAYSSTVGGICYDIVFAFLEANLRGSTVCVVESNFSAEKHSEHFRDLIARYDAYPIQVVCDAPWPLLYTRFVERAHTTTRHPWHLDATEHPKYRDAIENDDYIPLDIGGTIITVDTTDFSNIPYERYFDEVRILLAAHTSPAV